MESERKLNTVADEKFGEEIGVDGSELLVKIALWLELGREQPERFEEIIKEGTTVDAPIFGNLFDLPARLAQSIICRSELELFGKSLPRFGYRINLKHQLGFINLRRIETLLVELDDESADVVGTLLKGSPRIADAFLEKPRWVDTEWSVCSAKLGKACGEVDPGGSDPLFTPYIRHMRSGGGMCAQAAIFMVSALYSKDGVPVMGIPEITYLAKEANEESPPKYIDFDGLLDDELVAYFRNPRVAGLGAQWQHPTLEPFDFKHGDVFGDRSSLVVGLEQALSSYLLSGIPVIYAVDAGRMQGVGLEQQLRVSYHRNNGKTRVPDPLGLPTKTHSIYDCNRPPSDRLSTVAHRGHVVLLVGAKPPGIGDGFPPDLAKGTSSPRAEVEFLLHDPSHFPFMRATARQLLMAAAYEEERSADGSLLPPAELRLGDFLPVTPAAVTMPLLNGRTDTTVGILQFSDFLSGRRIAGHTMQNGPHTKQRALRGKKSSEFRLTQYGEQSFWRQIACWDIAPLPDNIRTGELGLFTLRGCDINAGHWIWLEKLGDQLYFWNAQALPVCELVLKEIESMHANYVDLDIFAPGLLLHSCDTNFVGRIQSFSRPPNDSTNRPGIETRQRSRLSTSLITSFESSNNWEIEIQKLATKPAGVEYYCMMKDEANRYFRRYLKGSQRTQSPLQVMADLCANEAAIRDVAEQISEKLSYPVVAFATYLPGLSSADRRSGGSNWTALKAVEFVMRLARKIRPQSSGSTPLIIELVGGTRIEGLSITPETANNPDLGERIIRASFATEKEAVQRLFRSLEQLVPLAAELETVLALELEPSVFGTLGSIHPVRDLCERIDAAGERDARWNRTVGLNLDIAHWAFLERADPDLIPECISRRFCHAHISAHSTGHFADYALEWAGVDLLRVPDEYVRWLEFYADRTRKTLDLPVSECVSVELECCKCISHASHSLETLIKLLA